MSAICCWVRSLSSRRFLILVLQSNHLRKIINAINPAIDFWQNLWRNVVASIPYAYNPSQYVLSLRRVQLSMHEKRHLTISYIKDTRQWKLSGVCLKKVLLYNKMPSKKLLLDKLQLLGYYFICNEARPRRKKTTTTKLLYITRNGGRDFSAAVSH